MGLGTKNRQNKRRTFASSISGKNTRPARLVEEFILEFEGAVKPAMSLVGTGSPTSKTKKKEMLKVPRGAFREGA
jgi:hypothetical protein